MENHEKTMMGPLHSWKVWKVRRQCIRVELAGLTKYLDTGNVGNPPKWFPQVVTPLALLRFPIFVPRTSGSIFGEQNAQDARRTIVDTHLHNKRLGPRRAILVTISMPAFAIQTHNFRIGIRPKKNRKLSRRVKTQDKTSNIKYMTL
jgi:hypothetical protein